MKTFHDLSTAQKICNVALLAVILGFVFAACSGSGEPSAFSIEARERFDYFVENVPEIDAIDCLDDCNSVAYIRWNEIPEGFESAMRGQAATFSVFKMQKTGTSHVTVFGTLNGSTLIQCSASKGRVDECE